MKKVFPVLTTPRLILRELQAKDAPRLTALLRDEDVLRYLTLHLTNITRKFIAHAHKAFLAGRELHRGICEKESGALMGVISVNINRGTEAP